MDGWMDGWIVERFNGTSQSRVASAGVKAANEYAS